MKSAFLEELGVMKKRLLESMEDYMTGDRLNNHFDVSYGPKDVSECSRILDDYIQCLQNLDEYSTRNDIMKCVKTVVLQLNELSTKRPDLINPTKREELFDYIEFAAKGAGLKEIDEDITEKWREW